MLYVAVADLPDIPTRVHRDGAPWLDETRPAWFIELDTDLLDMKQACSCVLGQFVSNVRVRTLYNMSHNGRGGDVGWEARLAAQETLYGYGTCVTNEFSLEGRRNTLAPYDALAPLVMSYELAIRRGFHINGDDPDREDIGENYAEWEELTVQWAAAAQARKMAWEYARTQIQKLLGDAELADFDSLHKLYMEMMPVPVTHG